MTKPDGWGGDVFPAKNFVDGVGNTFVHTSCYTVPWIEVDLGKITTIDKIVILNRKDCCQNRIIGSTVSILDEDRAPVYISNAITVTAKSYTWLPSSPKVQIGDNLLVPENYSLSFNIYPMGTIRAWANVLHYTFTNSDSGRMPALMLYPNTLFLHVRFSTVNNLEEGLEIYNPLTANATTTVRVEAVGKMVSVYYNDTLQKSVLLQGNRMSGYADRYINNDPLFATAKATINKVEMKSITDFSDPLKTNTSLTIKTNDTWYSLQPCVSNM